MTGPKTTGARSVLLISGLVYPMVVVAIIVVVSNDDPFTMFSPGYWALCFVALPVVWAFFSILGAQRFGVLPKRWLVFHLVVLGALTFAHFWVLSAFAGGV